MKDKFFVPYETAKRLKEKGYPQKGSSYWRIEEEERPRIVDYWLLDEDEDRERGYSHISAPTYHEVIDWLEGKGIRVFAHYYIDNGKWVYVIEDFKRLQDNAGFFHTREEALNAAILKALELI